MKLVEKRSQYRRDFTGVYECENCGHPEVVKGCYDDAFFHENVAPGFVCIECGESTNSLGLKPEEVEKLLSDLNISLAQLPKIKLTDPSLEEDAEISDVLKIERVRDGEKNIYYRVVSV